MREYGDYLDLKKNVKPGQYDGNISAVESVCEWLVTVLRSLQDEGIKSVLEAYIGISEERIVWRLKTDEPFGDSEQLKGATIRKLRKVEEEDMRKEEAIERRIIALNGKFESELSGQKVFLKELKDTDRFTPLDKAATVSFHNGVLHGMSLMYGLLWKHFSDVLEPTCVEQESYISIEELFEQRLGEGGD